MNFGGAGGRGEMVYTHLPIALQEVLVFVVLECVELVYVLAFEAVFVYQASCFEDRFFNGGSG